MSDSRTDLLIEALLLEIRGARDEQTRQGAQIDTIQRLLEQGRGARDTDDIRVIHALTDSGAGATRFSTAEVIRHAATVAPELQAALEAAGCDSPRSLGRLFRRVEGRCIHGVSLHRVGEDRHGLVWVLRVCVTARDREI